MRKNNSIREKIISDQREKVMEGYLENKKNKRENKKKQTH